MIWEERTQSKKLPVEMYFKWKSFTKVESKDADWDTVVKDKFINKFESYDKDLQTTHQLTPDQFIVLEVGYTITGWNASENAYMYSNMIRNLKTEELTVRTQWENGETVFTGVYDRDAIKKIGGKFTSNVIVLEKWILCNYQFTGGELLRWNEDKKLINTNKYKVKFDGFEELVNGKVKYTVPKWKQGDVISDEEWKDINDKVEILKEYFSS